MGPTSLGMYAAAQLYDAVGHLTHVAPAELWARFLGWTRTPPPVRSDNSAGWHYRPPWPDDPTRRRTSAPANVNGSPRGADRGQDGKMIELTTPRLLLRPLTVAYLDAFAGMYADPQVMRYIADGAVLDREQTAANLADKERHWREHGYGIFAVHLRDTDEPAGWVGLAVPLFLPEVLPAVEIGWRLARPFWGAGIATEAAREVLRFAFDDRGLDRLVSIRHVDNHASGRVMEKLGLRLDRRTVVPPHGRPVDVLAITRDEYHSQDRQL
jgi:RimJ/RimL family protein N-acetyltransferase